MSKNKEKTNNNPKDTCVDFNGLGFEDVLADLLQIKPVENEELRKDGQKKKRKTKTTSKGGLSKNGS